MEKKPFVTKEQVEEIVKNIPHLFTFMMKRNKGKRKKS